MPRIDHRPIEGTERDFMVPLNVDCVSINRSCN